MANGMPLFLSVSYYGRLTRYDHLPTPAACSTDSTITDPPAQSSSSIINDAPFPEFQIRLVVGIIDQIVFVTRMGMSPIESLILLRSATLSVPSLQVPVSWGFFVLSLGFSVLRTGRYGPR